MSSQMSRRPVFRLTLGYPILTIAAEPAEPEGADPAPRRAAPTEIDLAKPGYADQLRALGVAVRRARGVLRAILPEREVWRGLVAGAGAEAAARAALGPGEIVLIAEAPLPSGETPCAAALRATLAEARRFLRRHGLRPASFAGAGDFPGFSATPRFPAGVTPSAPLLAALARRARAIRPALPGIADLLPGWPPSGAFVAGGGLAAACAAVALVAALAPGGLPVAPAPERLAVLEAPPAAQVLMPRTIPPKLIAAAAPPALRPEAEARPRRAERDMRIAMSAPALPRPSTIGAAPIVVMGTRNMAELEGVRVDSGLTAERVAELVGAPLTRSDMTGTPPRARPAAARSAAVAPVDAAVPDVILDENGAILRPAARPAQRAAVAAALGAFAAGASSEEAAEGPRARPRGAAKGALSPAIVAAVNASPIRVASLSPEIPGAATPPEPRPERAAATPKPATPKPATPKPAAVMAAPVVTRAPEPVAVSAPQAVAPRLVVAPQPAAFQPAAFQPVRPAPQTQTQTRVAATSPGSQQRRSFAAAGANRAAGTSRAVETSGIARGGLSLLGVFGTSGARHALIRLPNGAVQRVRPGDTVAGAAVAAVSEDAVRLTGSGRDVVLRVE